mmetsp:Transcript_26806/g.59053  ORF Transcript_26806/g.59053 Transcript_26806/m.59053 type:complete len:380 (+) Transcript_26806:792-1931(+)
MNIVFDPAVCPVALDLIVAPFVHKTIVFFPAPPDSWLRCQRWWKRSNATNPGVLGVPESQRRGIRLRDVLFFRRTHVDDRVLEVVQFGFLGCQNRLGLARGPNRFGSVPPKHRSKDQTKHGDDHRRPNRHLVPGDRGRVVGGRVEATAHTGKTNPPDSLVTESCAPLVRFRCSHLDPLVGLAAGPVHELEVHDGKHGTLAIPLAGKGDPTAQALEVEFPELLRHGVSVVPKFDGCGRQCRDHGNNRIDHVLRGVIGERPRRIPSQAVREDGSEPAVSQVQESAVDFAVPGALSKGCDPEVSGRAGIPIVVQIVWFVADPGLRAHPEGIPREKVLRKTEDRKGVLLVRQQEDDPGIVGRIVVGGRLEYLHQRVFVDASAR